MRQVCAACLKALYCRALVDYFRHRTIHFAEGEFWGKTVRAARLILRQIHDAELQERLRDTVADLLSTQDADGCISVQTSDRQPLGSDIWERKNVMLGLLEWYELTRDERVLAVLSHIADQLLTQVVPGAPCRITDTDWALAGIESISILESMVRLHRQAVMAGARGPVLNLYLPGTLVLDLPDGGRVELAVATAYPRSSRVRIVVRPDRPRYFALSLRVPAWSTDTRLAVIGTAQAAIPGTLAKIERLGKPGDALELELDPLYRAVRDPRGGHIALRRGPLVLPRDRRLGGDLDAAVDRPINAYGLVAAREVAPAVAAQVQVPSRGLCQGRTCLHILRLGGRDLGRGLLAVGGGRTGPVTPPTDQQDYPSGNPYDPVRTQLLHRSSPSGSVDRPVSLAMRLGLRRSRRPDGRRLPSAILHDRCRTPPSDRHRR